MRCSLVAWEEDDAWAVSCDECGALDFDKRAVLLCRRQNKSLWLLALSEKEGSGFSSGREPSRNAANFLEGKPVGGGHGGGIE